MEKKKKALNRNISFELQEEIYLNIAVFSEHFILPLIGQMMMVVAILRREDFILCASCSCKTLYDKVQDWEKTGRIMGHSAESVTKQFYYDLNFDDIEDIADMLS